MVTTTQVKTTDLAIGVGRTLRVTLSDDCVTLAAGYGGRDTGDPFTRPHWVGDPLQIPAGSVPGLLRALEAMLADEQETRTRAPRGTQNL